MWIKFGKVLINLKNVEMIDLDKVSIKIFSPLFSSYSTAGYLQLNFETEEEALKEYEELELLLTDSTKQVLAMLKQEK